MMKITIMNVHSQNFLSIVIPIFNQNLDLYIPVTSNSMYPLLKHKRDLVLLTRCHVNLLKKGDIVLYKRDTGQVILQRIVAVNDDYFDMCGDAETQVEYNVPSNNIIAVVKTITRNGKEISCNFLIYKLFSVLWVQLLPYRQFLQKASHYGKRIWYRV